MAHIIFKGLDDFKSPNSIKRIYAAVKSFFNGVGDAPFEVHVKRYTKTRAQERKFHAMLGVLVKKGVFYYGEEKTEGKFESINHAKDVIIEAFWQDLVSQNIKDFGQLVEYRKSPISQNFLAIRKPTGDYSLAAYSALIECTYALATDFFYKVDGQYVRGVKWPEYIKEYDLYT